MLEAWERPTLTLDLSIALLLPIFQNKQTKTSFLSIECCVLHFIDLKQDKGYFCVISCLLC